MFLFPLIITLLAQNVSIGGFALLKGVHGRFVYYLITKERYNHKPTYNSLTQSCTAMRYELPRCSIPCSFASFLFF